MEGTGGPTNSNKDKRRALQSLDDIADQVEYNHIKVWINGYSNFKKTMMNEIKHCVSFKSLEAIVIIISFVSETFNHHTTN